MKISKLFLASILILSVAGIAAAQDTAIITNSDGSYTVVEYPADKEFTVNLLPSGSFAGKGMARVHRTAKGTRVFIDVNGVPATTTSVYAYAVDPNGTPTLLGPVKVNNGVATAEFMTPMDKFMLVLSPTGTMKTMTSDVYLTSDVPEGLTVLPRGAVVTRTVTTTTTSSAAGVPTQYQVPLLNVSSFGKDSRTANLEFKHGELKGLDAKAHIHRHDTGTTVRVELDDLRKVSPAKRFVLWAYSPDGTYTRLGQLHNWKDRDEAKIEAKTNLTDFGLLMTVEDAEVMVPTSTVWSVFRVS